MRVGFLGAGCWGFCLAAHLAMQGCEVICWTRRSEVARLLNETKEHPNLPGHRISGNVTFTSDMAEMLSGVDLLVEAVTSAGIRPVFRAVSEIGTPSCPIVLTSKGIEQDSGLILPEVVAELLGEKYRPRVTLLSGPSFAKEVIKGLPTSVVASAFDRNLIETICDAFNSGTFRVYPNADIYGVSYGGALKNVIAIACGISEGLGLGASSKAALMTRGLHEMRKLSIACGCLPDTINGLSGMGDCVLTCNSLLSRNFRFGYLLAEGAAPKGAEMSIGMVVEGVYTSVSALQLSEQHEIAMPITKSVYDIVFNNLKPIDAVQALMQRAIKEEHL